MSTKMHAYDWPTFAKATASRSIYILGAGVSIPLISGQVSEKIRRCISDNGIFEVSLQPDSPLKNRLLPSNIRFDIKASKAGTVSENELIARTPSNLVELFFAQAITLPQFERSSQYDVFNRFASSIIFNFNNDNLAACIHPQRHLCLRPHGVVNSDFVHHPLVAEAMRALIIPDSFIDHLKYHRPLPEHRDITSSSAYQAVIRFFRSVEVVVLIGYSFGEQTDTGLIDDSETFEMLSELLRWCPKPILIIDPKPDRIFDRIAASLRRPQISVLRCRWNVLAEFIVSGGYVRAFRAEGSKRNKSITEEYWKF
jgi:hypothetical protein